MSFLACPSPPGIQQPFPLLPPCSPSCPPAPRFSSLTAQHHLPCRPVSPGVLRKWTFPSNPPPWKPQTHRPKRGPCRGPGEVRGRAPAEEGNSGSTNMIPCPEMLEDGQRKATLQEVSGRSAKVSGVGLEESFSVWFLPPRLAAPPPGSPPVLADAESLLLQLNPVSGRLNPCQTDCTPPPLEEGRVNPPPQSFCAMRPQYK